MATPTTRIPITTAASVSPPLSMSAVPSGANTTPPSDTPVNAMLIARARRWTNQRASMALTPMAAASPNPTAITR